MGAKWNKFSPDGAILPFCGNTFLCWLPAESALHASLRTLAAALAASPFADRLIFLPPSSYHLTIQSGVEDLGRLSVTWPSDLDPDTPLAACTALFHERLRLLRSAARPPPPPPPPPYRVRAIAPHSHSLASAVQIELIDDGGVLRVLRDLLADQVVRTPPPAHASARAGFHITIAYLRTAAASESETEALRTLVSTIWRQIGVDEPAELAAVKLCTYEDMVTFQTVATL